MSDNSNIRIFVGLFYYCFFLFVFNHAMSSFLFFVSQSHVLLFVLLFYFIALQMLGMEN